jgi:hypothetical protein
MYGNFIGAITLVVRPPSAHASVRLVSGEAVDALASGVKRFALFCS